MPGLNLVVHRALVHNVALRPEICTDPNYSSSCSLGWHGPTLHPFTCRDWLLDRVQSTFRTEVQVAARDFRGEPTTTADEMVNQRMPGDVDLCSSGFWGSSAEGVWAREAILVIPDIRG